MTKGLRTLMRLDPDVVLVGEIRDAEAAETAMRAASSGKYVFSSLHTRDVASTITALRDLHIDNRSLAGNLAGIISQRLVRRLCVECSRSEPVTDVEASMFLQSGLNPPAEIRHPVGCPHCRVTGYYDRVGLFEVVTSADDIVKAIEAGDAEDEMRSLIRSHGLCTLEKDALQKVAEGIIGVREIQTMSSIEFERRVCTAK
jgi:type IV pilus assembly protein PilB